MDSVDLENCPQCQADLLKPGSVVAERQPIGPSRRQLQKEPYSKCSKCGHIWKTSVFKTFFIQYLATLQRYADLWGEERRFVDIIGKKWYTIALSKEHNYRDKECQDWFLALFNYPKLPEIDSFLSEVGWLHLEWDTEWQVYVTT